MSAPPSHDVAETGRVRVTNDDTESADREPTTTTTTTRLRLPNALAYALVAFEVTAVVVLPFAVIGGGTPLLDAWTNFDLHNVAIAALLGALILWRRPGHVIGWLLVAAGGFDSLVVAAAGYRYYRPEGFPGLPSGNAAWETLNFTWVLSATCLLIVLPQLFPAGRVLSRRWRPLLWFGVAAPLPLATLFFLEPGSASGDFDSSYAWAFPLFGLATLTSLVPLVVRFRRSVGVERQQLKWVFYGLGVSIPVCAVGFALIGARPSEASPLLTPALTLVPLVAIPAVITIAVLRYRLYDIDVVISRTLLVAGLAGFVTVAYVAIVVGVGSLFGQGDEPNLALSVAATAVVAVAFQPVRRGLQRAANRVVFGRRATPYDVLSGFATRVGAAEPSAETLVQLAELMARGTGADPARVWLRVGPDLRPSATWPPASDSDQRLAPVTITDSGARSDRQTDSAAGDAGAVPALPDADLAVPVRDRGELLGVLTIAKPRGERLTEIDTDLLGRLAAASGVLLRNLRLDAELAQRLTDLEASRRRLLSAQNDARQRIEEDLAGGSRAQLAALRERLSALAGEVDTGAAPKTALLLAQLVTATAGAMSTLDGLAAGVYPPRLAAEGLPAALTERATKAALPVSVHAEGVGRYPAEVETAVYFSVLEALQNVAKYAAADSARVRLAQDDGQLSFEVVDDGAGFDPETTQRGTGLQGMADRLDTVGGTMSVHSAPGRGTTITGQVPIQPIAGPTPRASAEPELAGATR